MFRRFLYANFRLVYRFSRFVRQYFTANGLLILAVMPVAAIFGLDTRSTLSFQVAALTLALIFAAVSYRLFFRSRYQVTRQLPDFGTVGTPVTYTCLIQNNNAQAQKHLLLSDELRTRFPEFNELTQGSDPLHKQRNWFDRTVGYPRMVSALEKKRGGKIPIINIDYIGRNSGQFVTLTLTPLRRGYLLFDCLRIMQTDPLGIFQAQKKISAKGRLLILPELFNTPGIKLKGKRLYHAGGNNRSSLTSDSQEFISLRQYRPGDPLKAIHWRSYARIGEPVVREYQDEYFVRYGLILDTHQPAYVTNEAFESAISIAASYIANQRGQEVLLDLMFVEDQTYYVTSGNGHRNSRSILEMLACIHAAKKDRFDALRPLVRKHSRECCGFMLVLLSLDEPRMKLLQMLDDYSLDSHVLFVTDSNPHLNEFSFQHIEINLIRPDNCQTDLNRLAA